MTTSAPSGIPGRGLQHQTIAVYRAGPVRAMKAQREGNWALYGDEIRKLGEAIRKMQ